MEGVTPMSLNRLGHVKSEQADVAERNMKVLPRADAAAPALRRYEAQPDSEDLACVDN